MDKELRDLERLAKQGDRDALNRLLVHRLRSDTFTLDDLGFDLQKELAMELARSLRGDLTWVDAASVWMEIFTESDPNFIEGYDDPMWCPECGDEEDWGKATGHIEVLANFVEVIPEEDTDAVLDGFLRCYRCGVNWRAPETLGMADDDIRGFFEA